MNITGQDAFFLTFIATWFSVRLSIWGQENVVPLIILIMCVFFYTLLIGWLRDCLNERKIVYSTFLFIPIIGVFGCIMLIVAYAPDYLKKTDIILLISISTMWIIITILEKLNFDITFTSRSNHEKKSSDNTTF